MKTKNFENQFSCVNHRRNHLRVFAVLSFIFFALASLNAQVYVKVCPRPPAHVRSASPHPKHIWIDGDWVYNGRNYVWREGYWAAPRHGHTWIPGHWKNTRRGNKWVPGHYN